MANKSKDETRMTLYRLTGLPAYESAIRAKYRSSDDANGDGGPKVCIANTEAYLYWNTVNHDRAQWTDIVKGLTGKELTVGNTTASAVLVIPYSHCAEQKSEVKSGNDHDSGKTGDQATSFSAWAITFGMGFQMLEPQYIDPGFGQRIAIRCAKPDGLNTLSKTTLDERPEMVRSTIPSGASLRSFGFEELGDFATRLVTEGHIAGIGDSKKPIKVSGADSLNIPLSKSPKKLLNNLEQIKAVLEKDPVNSELAALEHLSLVKDSTMKHKLDQLLIKAIGEKSNQVALSYPYEIIDDFGQVVCFKIIGTRKRKPSDYLPTLDDLLAPILKVNEDQRLKRLGQLSVVLYKSTDAKIGSPRIPVKQWLTFQATLDDKRYFLQNNRWYVMDSDYAATLLKQVEAIFKRDPGLGDLPDWNISKIPENEEEEKTVNSELSYNKKLAKKLGGLCLDQQLIWPKGSTSGIEACDVLLPDGVFIHVKHLSSSAPASHLLAQALVATDLLRTDQNAQQLLEKKIKSIAKDTDFEKYKMEPRRVVIVIAKDDEPITAESLFTFTKINLLRHDQQLASMNVKLYVIPVVRKHEVSNNSEAPTE